MLKEFGLNPDRVAVFAVGGEQLVGEVLDTGIPAYDRGTLTGIERRVKNPKRIIRLQNMDQRTGSLTIEFLLGNYDFISEGEIQIQSHFAYWLNKVSVDSQLNIFSLFVGFSDRRRAQQSGLVIPEIGLSGPQHGK